MAVIKNGLVGYPVDRGARPHQEALTEAARTIQGIEGMDILETTATVAEGRILESQTHVGLRFLIERERWIRSTRSISAFGG